MFCRLFIYLDYNCWSKGKLALNSLGPTGMELVPSVQKYVSQKRLICTSENELGALQRPSTLFALPPEY